MPARHAAAAPSAAAVAAAAAAKKHRDAIVAGSAVLLKHLMLAGVGHHHNTAAATATATAAASAASSPPPFTSDDSDRESCGLTDASSCASGSPATSPRFAPARAPRLPSATKAAAEVAAPAAAATTVFDAACIPPVSLRDYVKRWVAYFPVDIVVVGVVYVRRWLAGDAARALTEANVHRVLLSAFIIAVKWHSDRAYSLTGYSQVAGVVREELPRLESTFLCELEWACHVSGDEFRAASRTVLRAAEASHEEEEEVVV